MGDFRQRGGNRFGGSHGGFSGHSGNRDRGPVTMHQAICSQCGKPCEVPFEPTSGKPVYCSECFESKRDSDGGRDSGRFPQKSFNSYRAPSAPTFNDNAGKSNNEDLKKQFESLNVKMDQLIKMVGSMVSVKPIAVENKAKEAVKETIKKPLIVKTKKVTKAIVKKAKKK